LVISVDNQAFTNNLAKTIFAHLLIISVFGGKIQESCMNFYHDGHNAVLQSVESTAFYLSFALIVILFPSPYVYQTAPLIKNQKK